MTPEAVRELALSLPETEEKDHWGCPSFRVRDKIFATLRWDEVRVVIKATQADQMALVQMHPESFSVVPNGRIKAGPMST